MSDLQQVLQLAQAGRFDQAIRSWRQISKQHPTDPNLLAIGGSLYAQSGDRKSASRCFKEALRLNPSSVQARLGLGQLAKSGGQLDQALEHLRAAHQAAPDDLNVINALAFTLRDAGELEEAERLLGPAAARTDHPAIRLNHANLLLAMGRYEDASEIFQRLLQSYPDKAGLHQGLGMAQLGLDQLETAVASLERAAELAPQSPPVLLNLARARKQAGQLSEAAECFEALMQLQPDAYEAAVELAAVYRELGRAEGARIRLDEAINTAPGRIEAYRDRIALAEESNDLDAAAETLEAACKQFPEEPLLQVLEARLLRRGKRYAESIEILESLGEQAVDEVERRRQHELALALDRKGEAQAAWAAMLRFNDLTTAEPTSDPYFDTLLERCREQGAARLREASGGHLDDDRAPVFLVGFPRSGTTLMGRILGAHPEAFELEETPILNELARDAGWPDQPLTAEAAEELRRRYFERAAAYGHDGRRRIVDRMPISMIHASLIRALWPDAPIIFMKRNPGDVCLSCLFQDFRLNWVTKHFRDPDETVRFYREVTDLWLQSAPQLDPAPIVVEYEKLVAEPEREVRRTAKACGLGYVEGMVEARTEAPASKTASYAQVAEPIHTGSIGRWEAYRECFGEALAAELDEMATRLGYGR